MSYGECVSARGLVIGLVALACLGLPATAGAADRFRRADPTIAVNPQHDRPSSVPAQRFYDVTVAAAGFWGTPVAGTTTAVPGRLDGVQVAGFSDELPDDALGLWAASFHRVYKRVRRCTRASSGRLRCRKVRKYSYSLIDEADVMVAVGSPWNPGPEYPSSRTFDLPTVLIHEFDHFAHPNARHEHGCANSALVDSLAPGEWWRSEDDWFRWGCSNSPSTRARPAASARKRVGVRLHRGPDQVLP